CIERANHRLDSWPWLAELGHYRATNNSGGVAGNPAGTIFLPEVSCFRVALNGLIPLFLLSA
ncbi:MAG: hypothetical protein ACTH7Y_10620, partial [Halomonas sp.]